MAKFLLNHRYELHGGSGKFEVIKVWPENRYGERMQIRYLNNKTPDRGDYTTNMHEPSKYIHYGHKPVDNPEEDF